MSVLGILNGRARPRVDDDEGSLLDIREDSCVVKAIVDDEGGAFDCVDDFWRGLPYRASDVDFEVIFFAAELYGG